MDNNEEEIPKEDIVEEEFYHKEPGALSYVLAVILCSAASYLIASYWLDFASPLAAVLLGAFGGLMGFFSGETIFESIIFTIFMSVILFILATTTELAFIKHTIVPIAVGLSVGKLSYGIWDAQA